jgi:hypothetical protein
MFWNFSKTPVQGWGSDARQYHSLLKYWFLCLPKPLWTLYQWFPKWGVPPPGGRWRWAPPSALFAYLRFKWLQTRHWETDITSSSPSIALKIYWEWSSYWMCIYLILLLISSSVGCANRYSEKWVLWGRGHWGWVYGTKEGGGQNKFGNHWSIWSACPAFLVQIFLLVVLLIASKRKTKTKLN